MGVGNSTNRPDRTDIQEKTPQGTSSGHKGGRRVAGGSNVVGTRKHVQLREARSTSKSHVKKFRSGEQDARDQAGPQSPSALQVKTRRRGNGPMTRMPNASGGE